MRTFVCITLALVAVLSAYAGSGMPLMLPSQAAMDRAYYKDFESAASYINTHGKLPANDQDGLRGSGHADRVIRSTSDIPSDCDHSFVKAPNDRLVLSFWRGEWTECYAYPSGRTTLSTSVRSYVVSKVVFWWLLAAGALWSAIHLRPRRSTRPRTARNVR